MIEGCLGRAELRGIRGLVFRLIYSFVLALGIGYLTASSQLSRFAENGTPRYGPWKSVQWLAPETGVSDFPGKLYLSANRALDQGLPEDHREILTFEALSDSSGAALQRSCAYTVTGSGAPVAWWSLYANYSDRQQGPVHNPRRSGAFARQPFVVKIDAQSGDKSEPVGLVFRLYRPDAQFMTNISAAVLPVIEKELCG